MRFVAAVAFLSLSLAVPAGAREVRLPLTIEPPIVRQALVKQAFPEPGERAHVFGDEDECAYLVLEKPEVVAEPGRIRVRARGEAELAAEVGDTCLAPIVWDGSIEIFERPRLDDWLLRFDVVDSNLYGRSGDKAALVGPLWDRIKGSIQPHFGAVTIDLGGPFRELREFLPTIVPAENAEEASRVIETLRPTGVSVTTRGIVIDASFVVPDAPAPTGSPTPEPPLSPEEIGAFNARLDRWDAFLTFVVKSLAAETLSEETRRSLLELLIEARYRVLESLETPVRHPDPIRGLFLRAWARLAPIASELAAVVPSGGDALRITTFVAGGDALSALDAAAPSFGVEVSSDGLRRLARMLEPDASGDPLESLPGVDPTLRDLFGFAVLPERTPTPDTVPTPMSFWRWLAPRAAYAATEKESWREWIFRGQEDLLPYVRKMGRLLRSTAGLVAATRQLAGATGDTYRRLVPATAWQESCWRQFVARAGEVTYIRSSRGSVGIMQVNERVWRGFYDQQQLRWDVKYNARAGAEILERYFALARDRGPAVAKDPKRLALATYAAYNGGPEQLRRYLDTKRKPSKALKRVIDKLFGDKFDAPDGELEAKVSNCLVGGGID
jgi:hypothetical protein